MIKPSLLGATTLASLFLALSPVMAGGANRAWVSGHGSDAAGCGAPSNPCRTLQYVHDNVIAAGGEIDILDPAGYGAVTINKALSIVNDGVGTAGVQAASGAAITINAGAGDVVALRGLNIDGLGTGTNGIVFNSGGGLTIVNCVVRHFAYASGNFATGDGILIRPTSGSMSLLISNVIASDNGYAGVAYYPSGNPSVTGEIDHVTAVNNQIGLTFDSVNASSGSAAFAVSDSVASNNAGGINVDGVAASAALTVSVDKSSMSGNSDYGLAAQDTPNVLLGRSVLVSNRYGVQNFTSPSTVYTYGDNRINGNAIMDVSGALNTADKPQ